MFNEGKIVIIGASNVGTAVLNKIVDFGLASEVVLIDINEKNAWVSLWIQVMLQLALAVIISIFMKAIMKIAKMLV